MVHTQDDNLTALNKILSDSSGIILTHVLDEWCANIYTIKLKVGFGGRGSTFSEALHNLNNEVDKYLKKEKSNG